MDHVIAYHLLLIMVRLLNVHNSVHLLLYVPVPSRNITNVTQGQPTDTSHTITITLPLTEYQPEQLLIISTIEPPSDDGPIMANFTSSSMQYTVTFTGLTGATIYNFTIRIVLRSNNTADVVRAATGSFMTMMTPSESSTLIDYWLKQIRYYTYIPTATMYTPPTEPKVTTVPLTSGPTSKC